MRPDHLGVYGYEKDTSPNIDEISKESVVFKNAYVPSPFTVPAHISLLTGLHSKDFKIFNNAFNKEVNDISLATLFKDKGYETAAFISSDLLDNYFFRQGFNSFDFKPEKTREEFIFSLDEFPWITKRNNEKTNEKAINWLEQNYGKDFFLFVHYYDAGPPFDNNCGRNFSHDLDQPSNKIFSKGTVFPFIKPSNKDIEFLKAKYDEGVFCDDKSVGEIIEKLKNLDIYNDATIILISDHGEFFDHPMLFHGYTLYEESIKVAMIIKSPFLKSNIGGNETPVLLTDVFPALSETFQLLKSEESAVGFNLFNDIQQRDLFFITPNLPGTGSLSLLPLLPAGSYDESVKQEKVFFYKGVISDKKKLIMGDNDDYEVYDLSTDSGETINLKNNKLYNKFKEEGKNKTEDFFSEISLDDLPINANQPTSAVQQEK